MEWNKSTARKKLKANVCRLINAIEDMRGLFLAKKTKLEVILFFYISIVLCT